MSILEDKDTIREVMAAYCQALDACRFAEVASLFAADAIWTTDYGEAKGRDAIERMLRGIVPVKGEGPQCREPEVRTTIAASPIANFGFEAALES